MKCGVMLTELKKTRLCSMICMFDVSTLGRSTWAKILRHRMTKALKPIQTGEHETVMFYKNYHERIWDFENMKISLGK